MKHMDVNRLDTETRRLQIKRAALDIISHEGLSKLSTRNLASNVGVAEGTIFHHFKNKENIILSIIDDVETKLLSVQKAIAYGNAPANIRLKDFMCSHIRFLFENKGVNIILFSEAAYMNRTELKSRLNNILLTQKEYIKTIINDGINDKIWDKNVSSENFATLYLGIPISLNVEIILEKDWMYQEKFCENMFLFLNRILKKV